MRHGPPARNGIAPLHCDGEALSEVARLSRITSNGCDAPAELGDEFLTLHPPCPQRLKSQRYKGVRDGDLHVFRGFCRFRLCCC